MDAVPTGYHELGHDALIAIFGNGSLEVLQQLAQKAQKDNGTFLAIPETANANNGVTCAI